MQYLDKDKKKLVCVSKKREDETPINLISVELEMVFVSKLVRKPWAVKPNYMIYYLIAWVDEVVCLASIRTHTWLITVSTLVYMVLYRMGANVTK